LHCIHDTTQTIFVYGPRSGVIAIAIAIVIMGVVSAHSITDATGHLTIYHARTDIIRAIRIHLRVLFKSR
jgi:hypothetical protein